ncbi:MAG: hypothetical protein ACR2H5_20965 [Ktedonobacteraceae bacterium]
MVSANSNTQKPLCPVCHQADKVQTLQAAFNTGLERFAQPKMPEKTVSMLKYMFSGIVVVAISAFLIIVLIGSETGTFNDVYSIPELILVVVILIAIITVLVLSYIAFNKVLRGDQESEKYYAALDRAMENWNHLRYCGRDDVIFDPETNKTVSEEALTSMMSVEAKEDQHISQQSTSPARH